MATKKSIPAALAIILVFWIFGQQAYSAEEPNSAEAEKQKKAVKKHQDDRETMITERVNQRIAELGEQLNLSDEQRKLLRPIVENEIKEIQHLRADSSISKEEKIEKMKAMRQTAQEEIKKILTPDQQKKLADVKEEIREKAKEDIAQHIQHRMTLLSEQLNLSEKQKKEIEPIIETEMTELLAARKDESLSKEQRQEQMKTIRQKSQEEIKKILTPRQQRKLALEREKGRGRITEKSKK